MPDDALPQIRLLDVPMTRLTIKPGDVIVLRLDAGVESLSPKEITEMLGQIHDAFPGHKVLALSHVGLEVARREPEP